MIYNLDFLPGAEDEIIDASQWYENKKEGLGLDFLLSVEAALFSVKRRPLSFQKVFSSARRAVIRRFPYGIFYVVEEDTITVIAVINFNRNPKLWQKRLPE
jgi:hypothetical protein